jgi:protein-tyrosine phosphatase
VAPTPGSRLAIPGTSNLRDLGGYPVTRGEVIAPGRLYRSEGLARPGAGEMHSAWDESNATQIRGLGLRTIIDLRSEYEREVTPTAWPDATGAEVVWLEIAEGGEGSDTNVMQHLLGGRIKRFDVADMGQFYCDVLDRRAAVFGEVVTVVAAADRLPALLHCSAGKDRTGLAVALVLSALGTPRETVVADYTLTGQFRPDRVLAYADRLGAAGLDVEDVRVLFETPAEVMETTLDHLDRQYGGAAAYLTSAGGLDEDVLEALRRSLVTSG